MAMVKNRAGFGLFFLQLDAEDAQVDCNLSSYDAGPGELFYVAWSPHHNHEKDVVFNGSECLEVHQSADAIRVSLQQSFRRSE